MQKKLLFIFGTRPEAIKLAPVILAFKKERQFQVRICVTGQHREMLDDVLLFFNMKQDYDLNVMSREQSLFYITGEALKGIEKILYLENPDYVFVQGDTTTALAGALAGFYHKIKIVHIEAGLRTYQKYSPFPEEMNRLLISRLVDIHFVPTEKAKQNLIHEGITKNIYLVGNPVVDALKLCLDKIKLSENMYRNFFKFIDFNKRIILVTGHRRENFDQGLKSICYALVQLAKKCIKHIEIIYPVHLNPNVQRPVRQLLNGIPNIHLMSPLTYPYFIYLMKQSYLIITDSGGVQEEASVLGKPVLILRDVTERVEGVHKGVAQLIGTEKTKIVSMTEKLLKNKVGYKKMAKVIHVYGDGKASLRIRQIITSKK